MLERLVHDRQDGANSAGALASTAQREHTMKEVVFLMVALETKAERALGAAATLTLLVIGAMTAEKATVEAILATDWCKLK